MAKALSNDLRQRVIEAIDRGLSCRQAAERYGVSASSASRWRCRLRQIGNFASKTQVGPYVNERDFSTTFETVDWSQARYADYGFIALDVTPAPHGRRTTMTLRFINEQGRELDRVVFSRTAGDVTPRR